MPRILGDIGAIHVRSLSAGLNLDLVVDATGKAGFGFDVGVLDKASLVFVLDYDVGFRQGLFHVAPDHAAPDQNIILPVGVDAFSIRRQARPQS